MIIIRVNVTIKPEERSAFVAQIKKEMIDVKQGFAGCARFNLYEDVMDENRFLLYEEWQTAENFKAYQTSDYFQENGKKLFPMMADKPDSAYFEAALVA